MKKRIFFIGACLALSIQMMAQPLVRTHIEAGDIEGVLDGQDLAVYKAVPYAAPPVGELRWRAPQPVEPWVGVKHTTDFGPWPPQPKSKYGDGYAVMNEDCLYLSVVTPATKTDERLPVMVWIHGGGFQTEWYGNNIWKNLAHRGVVTVSVEYRTGALGFMAHPELTKEGNGHSGNYGLLDQIFALQWVQRNISAFGGDPQKVTIFGESAGSFSVSMLCGSPLTKGLFRAAIAQSGALFYPTDEKRVWHVTNHSQKGAEQQGLAFQKHIKARSLKALRKMSAEQLTGDEAGFYGFWPCVDGYVIADDQYRLYEQGSYNDVPVIVMSNSDEGCMFSYERPLDEYISYIQEKAGKFSDEMLKLYPARTNEETFFSFADLWRDVAYAWPAYTWARLQTKSGKSPVYLGYLSHWMRPTLTHNPHRRGASHGDELFFLEDRIRKLNKKNRYDTEQAMSEVMQQYWVNFAKTMNPNAPGLPYWPAFKDGKPSTMEFNRGFRVIDEPNQNLMDFWDRFFEWKRGETENK